MEALEQELEFYEEHRHEILAANAGRFALIKGARLIGAFPTLEAAYRYGIVTFGNVPILIREIRPADPAHGIPAFTQGLLRARF